MTEDTAAILGWPFLVARGRRRGYRALLVPGFLAEAGQTGVLADGLRGDTVPGSPPRVESLSVPDVGRLSCAYRTERLGGRDPAGDSTSPVLDEHGRPLEFLYGVVVPTDDVLDPEAEDLDVARQMALSTYERFLGDEAGFPGERSRAFALRSTIAPRPAATSAAEAGHREEDLWVASRVDDGAPLRATGPGGDSRPEVLVGVLAVLGVLLAASVWVLMARTPTAPDVRVEIDQPVVEEVACGLPAEVRTTAVIEAANEARVSMYWQDSLDGWRSEQIEVVLDGAGAHSVPVSRDVGTEPGDPQRGELTLVVVAPRATEHSVEYVLTCVEP